MLWCIPFWAFQTTSWHTKVRHIVMHLSLPHLELARTKWLSLWLPNISLVFAYAKFASSGLVSFGTIMGTSLWFLSLTPITSWSFSNNLLTRYKPPQSFFISCNLISGHNPSSTLPLPHPLFACWERAILFEQALQASCVTWGHAKIQVSHLLLFASCLQCGQMLKIWGFCVHWTV